VIYLDTSVALAQLLAEYRRPPAALWRKQLIASYDERLLAGARALGLPIYDL